MVVSNVVCLAEPLPAAPCTAKVHSVFHKGFNLQDSSDGLLIWVSAERFCPHAPYPRSIICDELDLAAVRPGMTFFFAKEDGAQGESLFIVSEGAGCGGSIALHAGPETQRKAPMFVHVEPANSAGQWLKAVKAAIARKRAALDAPAAYFELAALLETRISLCAEAALSCQEEALAEEVRQLVGWGFGLTPSGDDALVGALAALKSFAPSAGERLVQAVRPRLASTTDVSRTCLELACQGYGSEHLIGVLSGFCGIAGNQSLDALLSFGHTSGQDTAMGVAAAMEAVLRHMSLRKEKADGNQ